MINATLLAVLDALCQIALTTPLMTNAEQDTSMSVRRVQSVKATLNVPLFKQSSKKIFLEFTTARLGSGEGSRIHIISNDLIQLLPFLFYRKGY